MEVEQGGDDEKIFAVEISEVLSSIVNVAEYSLKIRQLEVLHTRWPAINALKKNKVDEELQMEWKTDMGQVFLEGRF